MNINAHKILVSTICILSIVSLSAQCPPALPTANDGCSIEAGTADLSVSGSSGFYNWYNTPTGGNIINSGATYTTPFLTSNTNYYVSATGTRTSLSFDGTDDYVALNMFYNTVGQIPQVTLEAWVNTSENGTGTNSNWAIIDFDRSDYYNFFITGNNGQVGFSTSDNTGTIHDFYSGTGNSVNDGNWHHIAAVYDGTDKIIYIDGVEVARSVNAHGGNNLGSGLTRYGFIGDGSEATSFNGGRNNRYYNGKVDEVRIWNTVRSPAQLLANKDTCLAGTETGLFAYFNFDEGTGTTINDLTGNSHDGTLFNFSGSSFTPNALVACSNCESARTTVTANIISTTMTDERLSCDNSTITLDAGNLFSSYLWNTGETSQTIDVKENGFYDVTASGGPGGCTASKKVSVVGFTSSKNALLFDGTNDYVAIDNFFYDNANYTELTVEAWIKTTAGNNQIIASFDRNQFWRLEINGNGAGTGQVGFDLSTSSGQLDFGSTTRVDDGNWHHVVGVFDNGTVSIYIDGVLDATTTTGATFGTDITRYGFISRGSEASTFNGSTGPNDEFNGKIDEVRIWNTARTLTQIRNSMCSHISGNETGLEVYYKFDENSGNTVNDYSTSLISNGTMMNFGTSANVPSGSPLGDTSTYLYTGSWAGQSVNLNSCNGDHVTIDNVTSTPSGVHLYFVNNDPDSVTGIINYTADNHYFGTFTVNDTSSRHNITYSYPSHPLLATGDENDLALLTRTDNTVNSWSLSTSSVNTTLQQVTLNNQANQQFIIDKYQIEWTGNTNSDWNTANNWTTGIVPPSGTSISIPNVTNQPTLDQNRTIGGLTIQDSASLNLDGFTLNLEKSLSHNGTILSNNGTISFKGTTNAQFINTNGIIEMDHLSIDNSNGVTLSTGAINLSGTLSLTDGDFNTNNAVTLISNASGTGRIAEITGGSITGDITMQRYIDAGSTNWRFLSPPVSGVTIAELNDDVITSGFTDSDFPNFPFINILFYDETAPDSSGNGFVNATNITNAIGVGEGIWLWSGDTSTGTQPFTIDMKGPTNTGDINLPVTYTNTGNPDDDGWNMVGNPYPSTIDWDDASINRTNMDNALYIWNPDLEQYASYVGGIGINGGSRHVASSQGFWVKANAASPILQLTEASKDPMTANFVKQSTATASPLVINIQNAFGTDQTIINLQSNATNQFDKNFDAYKLASTNPNRPYISSLIPTSETEYAINQVPQQKNEILIKVLANTSGVHFISLTGITNFSNSCMILEDLFTGNAYDLMTTSSFSAFISDTTTTARFVLRLGTPTNISSHDISCHGNADGAIFLEKNASNDFEVTLKNNTGDVIANHNNINRLDSITHLKAGTYIIETTNVSCPNSMDTVTISEPLPVNAQFSVDTLMLKHNENINFTNLSSNATTYTWDFDDGNTSIDSSPSHQYFEANTYHVSLTAYQNENCFETFTKSITIIDQTTSVKENIETKPFAIYPNPLVGNDLTIVFNHLENNKPVEFELINLSGQLIYQKNIIPQFNSGGSMTIYIDRKLAKGTYVVKLISSDNLFTEQLIVK